MLLFDQARVNPAVCAWLVEFREKADRRTDQNFEELTVGVSCSSDTLRLGDDLVSYHASVAAMSLRSLPDAGELGISTWGGTGDYPGGVARKVVGPTVVCIPEQATGWQVRIVDPAVQTMRRFFGEAGSLETGGVLLGRSDAQKDSLRDGGLRPT